MSGYYNEYEHPELFDDEVEDQQPRQGGQLRKQLEEALKANKALNERLVKLERGRTVEDLLRGQGINPAVADMIPADQDPGEWVQKFGAFLPKGQAVTQEVSEQTPEVEEGESDISAEEREAFERTAGMTSDTGIPSTASQDQIEKLKSFTNEADLLRYIQSGGVES